MPNESIVENEDVAEVLEPEAQIRTVTVGKDPYALTYLQRPVSFFQKVELFALLGGALDKAMSGPDGLTVGDLFDGPAGLGTELNTQNLKDADMFVRSLAKLVQYSPDLLLDLYVVILGVPRNERAMVKDMMDQNEAEGGLSDEDGFGILNTFVDQNWDVLADFFGSRIKPLISKVSNKLQESAPSKPLKNTRRTTPKE